MLDLFDSRVTELEILSQDHHEATGSNPSSGNGQAKQETQGHVLSMRNPNSLRGINFLRYSTDVQNINVFFNPNCPLKRVRYSESGLWM